MLSQGRALCWAGAAEARAAEARGARRGPEERTRRPEPLSLGRPAGHKGQGCLTAEVAEGHGALVPTSPESQTPPTQGSSVSMATHGALYGAQQGPNKTEGETAGLRARAREGEAGLGMPRNPGRRCGITARPGASNRRAPEPPLPHFNIWQRDI